MQNKHIIYLVGFFAFFLASSLRAQERLVSVSAYPALANRAHAIPFKSLTTDTLKLPFLDDFSSGSNSPDSLLWRGQSAYLNNSFAVNPPTYGVATFDAIDSTGMIYSKATVESFLADALTSKPVDLFLPQDTTIYLSFFYQPEGYGDAPEESDSLIVEFFAPLSQRWSRVWSVPGTSSHDFKIVMINISDSKFLQKGFRFRFRNYASLSPSLDESLKVNADHWNIDYVYLNNYRHYNDTIMQDASLVKQVEPLLQNYTAMPWEHFRTANISVVKAIFEINLHNLSSDKRAYSPVLKITPVWVPGTGFEKDYQSEEIKAYESLTYDAAFNYGFTSSERDSALFEVSLDMNQTIPDQIPGNDKVVARQKFADYYAYDDGSSEAGYGLSGEGTKNGKIAYRFKTLNTIDSLSAIDICFNQSFGNAGRKYFTLGIWADDGNQPGDLIHSQTGVVAVYDGINAFQRVILDTAQVVPATYYVGWIQTTTDFLNVGYDRQNDHRSELFYNISGTWKPSSIKLQGGLMIRPVFSNKSRKSGIDQSELSDKLNNPVRIFPNPSNDWIRVECSNQAENMTITLTDLRGSVIRRMQKTASNCQMNVSDLPDGIYLIRVQSNSGINIRQKLIILHE